MGFFGGMFDPIHFGHINLALEMQEKWGLSKIIVCPAYLSPTRASETPTNGQHRLKMLQLAIEGLPSWEILDIEIQRQGTSYTIATIEYLLEKDSKLKENLALILGEDAAHHFFLWKDYKKIIEKAQILVGTRTIESAKRRFEDLDKDNILKKAVIDGLTTIHLMDISSTYLRQRLEKRLYCKHLIPGKVLDYIYEYQLYF